MTILRAKDLSLGYQNKKIIDDFNVTVPQGAVVGLVGPNGSGKTTILRAFAGLIKPLKGKVWLNQQDIWSIPSRKRAQMIGWVPQRERSAWALTVKEIVSLGRAPHRGWLLPLSAADQCVIENVLALTELSDLKDRKVNELSGGEFQRVLIARALAQEPRVLLLDEPTANLDIHHQMQVMDFVKELVAQQAITAIVAIHDLTCAARYCDRLILLSEGRQICDGKPIEVLQSEHIKQVFKVESCLYRDPWDYLTVSVRNGRNGNGSGPKK